jgi:hypothetical protein
MKRNTKSWAKGYIKEYLMITTIESKLMEVFYYGKKQINWRISCNWY